MAYVAALVLASVRSYLKKKTCNMKMYGNCYCFFFAFLRGFGKFLAALLFAYSTDFAIFFSFYLMFYGLQNF